MLQETTLVATLTAALGLAFVFGFVAVRLRMPALVGYLIAGVVVGPFTPGYVADTGLAAQLAEVGVILLMLGVGMHFSVRDLLAVRRIAVPGALGRMALITSIGALVAHAWGWAWGGSVVFGLATSIASTVVLLRALEELGVVSSLDGRIAVGWVVVEDLATVLFLVLLPALARQTGGAAHATAGVVLALATALLKVAAFVALMLFVGARVVPKLLAAAARTASRELFTLAVLALALGIGFGASTLFGVSFALGAFVAGIIIAESDVGHQATADALPLRDAFAVLFFVTVGMLFDPRVLVARPLAVLATVALITIGKAAASFGLLTLLRVPLRTSLTVAAGLAQIGEFSFVLAGLSVSLGVLPREGESLLLAGAILSIIVNPAALKSVAPIERWLRARPRALSLIDGLNRQADAAVVPAGAEDDDVRDHAVIVGFGRVGSAIGRALEREAIPFVVVERDRKIMERLRDGGVRVLFGDASRRAVLQHTRLSAARLLVVASPGAYQTRAILELARQLNPAIDTVVRTHSAGEQRYLEAAGVGEAVNGERELAVEMARYALRAWNTDSAGVERVLRSLRDQRGPQAPAYSDAALD